MGDIVLVEGSNQLNIALIPIAAEEEALIYESMSTSTTGIFSLGQTTMVKVQVRNPNDVAVEEVVEISGIGFSELSDNPITITIGGNSVNVARFNIIYDAIGTYTIYCEDLSTTVEIVQGEEVPGLGGIFLVGPGEFYELRDTYGTVYGTAEVTPSSCCFYGITFGGQSCRNAGTFDYDVWVGYLRNNAAEPDAIYSGEYQWSQMLGHYYNWQASGLSLDAFKAAHPNWDILGGMEMWFLSRIPAYCPFTYS